MTNHFRSITLALAILVTAAAMAAAQAPAGPGPAGAQGPGGGPPRPPAGPVKRTPDGKPDLSGHFLGESGGANYGLERRAGATMLPTARGVVVDPPDGRIPYQPWARTEFEFRGRPERGYDDPTAHCFVAGVPRSLYTPSPYHIVQTPEYVVILFERMAWRIIPLDSNRTHLPDNMRLWQGDSLGRWEGDTLVVETTNNNGKTWLNEAGDVISHAATIVERFTPLDADTIDYKATITDPIVLTAPYTIGFNIRRQTGEILEVACHEDNQDLEHLRHVKEEWKAQQKNQQQ